MKRVLHFAFFFVAGFTFMCCDKLIDTDKTENSEDEEISIYFTYNLPTDVGGSMTKATNTEVFDDFYKKIVSAELVAPSYNLILTDTTTSVKYEFTGNWNNHDMITLRTGTYHVVGASTASGENIQERCSFTFDEIIEIKPSASSITLNAKYDCFLLVFSTNDITTISNYNGESETSFFSFKTYKYAFVNDKLYKDGKQSSAYIGGTYNDSIGFKCYTGNLLFEKGRYYVYSSVTGGFMAPKMIEGGTEKVENENTINAVDMGLSVMWGDRCLGAKNTSDMGDYFAWGETYTHYITKEPLVWKDRLGGYSWYTYKYCTASNGSYQITKYTTTDVDNILEEEDDAAHVILGGKWRMPSMAEAEELIDGCLWTNVVIDDVEYVKITSKITGNYILQPLGLISMGDQWDGYSLDYNSSSLSWWVSCLMTTSIARHLDVVPMFGDSPYIGYDHRYLGRLLRPVCEK